jgi:hypothetical protein
VGKGGSGAVAVSGGAFAPFSGAFARRTIRFVTHFSHEALELAGDR